MKRKYYENPSITVTQLTNEDILTNSWDNVESGRGTFNDDGAIELPPVTFN